MLPDLDKENTPPPVHGGNGSSSSLKDPRDRQASIDNRRGANSGGLIGPDYTAKIPILRSNQESSGGASNVKMLACVTDVQ